MRRMGLVFSAAALIAAAHVMFATTYAVILVMRNLAARR